ncbi:hypothetical protein Hanom_Chr12g01148901 [Helianthus anomalus]
MSDDVNFLSQIVRDSMELQAKTIAVAKDPDVMESLQVRVGDLVSTRKSGAVLPAKDESVRISQAERDRILMTQEPPKPKPKPQSSGEDGRGVLYCELDMDNDVPNQH